MKEYRDYDPKILEIVRNLTLMDDDFMRHVFSDNIPDTELILRIILGRDDLKVKKSQGQYELKSPITGGRDIWLDILAEDGSGTKFNIEIQKEQHGANIKRARFHRAMLDSRLLLKNEKFVDIRDSYVIFITERDFFQKGKPLYHICQYIEETDEDICDGSHIIYVNGAYEGDDPLGHLMHDFRSTDPNQMYNEGLADSVAHFKCEERRPKDMCEAIENYAQEYARDREINNTVKMGIRYGATKEQSISDLRQMFDMTEAEALEAYTECAVG